MVQSLEIDDELVPFEAALIKVELLFRSGQQGRKLSNLQRQVSTTIQEESDACTSVLT